MDRRRSWHSHWIQSQGTDDDAEWANNYDPLAARATPARSMGNMPLLFAQGRHRRGSSDRGYEQSAIDNFCALYRPPRFFPPEAAHWQVDRNHRGDGGHGDSFCAAGSGGGGGTAAAAAAEALPNPHDAGFFLAGQGYCAVNGCVEEEAKAAPEEEDEENEDDEGPDGDPNNDSAGIFTIEDV